MSLEDYIKDLAPELQEKARACGSVEELLALAKESKVPLPDEALTAIAGGSGVDSDACGMKPKCPNCGSRNVACTGQERHDYYMRLDFVCRDCGTKFHEDVYDS